MNYPDMLFVFNGSVDCPPMMWSVEPRGDEGFAVIESYDCGKNWGTNCVLPTGIECVNFIAAWFSQWYE